jgi:hypothetical protein
MFIKLFRAYVRECDTWLKTIVLFISSRSVDAGLPNT